MKPKDNSIITLRIRKKFFDQIISGEKTVEYRAVKPFYKRLLTRSAVSHVKLHYQAPRQAIVGVKSIRRVQTPKRLRLTFGEYVFAIRLGKAKEFTHE